MVIIGFSCKTSKSFVRLVCGRFKHCVVITRHKNKFVLHQFVKRNYVSKIAITKRGLKQLKLHGWIFIHLHCSPDDGNVHALTCVNYVKSVIGLKKFWIQTPNALYKYLNKN